MTHKTLILLVSTTLYACAGRQTNKNTDTVSTDTFPTTHIDSKKHTDRVISVDKVDTFFFTNSYYKEIGDRNQLEMFTFQSPNTLLICGKSVDELKYKIGDNIREFLAKNIEGIDTMNLKSIEIIDWSTDLRGDDTKLFIFKTGRLTEIKDAQ